MRAVLIKLAVIAGPVAGCAYACHDAIGFATRACDVRCARNERRKKRKRLRLERRERRRHHFTRVMTSVREGELVSASLIVGVVAVVAAAVAG